MTVSEHLAEMKRVAAGHPGFIALKAKITAGLPLISEDVLAIVEVVAMAGSCRQVQPVKIQTRRPQLVVLRGGRG